MYVSTKIICTIGPAVESLDQMIALIESGMNVARINFSHGDYEQHIKIFKNLKKAREEMKKPLAIMLDTKGPEIRIKKVFNNLVEVQPHQKFRIVKEFTGKEDEIQIDPFCVVEVLEVNKKILFNDGYIIAKVIEKKKDAIIEILNSGELKNQNSVNIPECSLNLPALTKKDIEDLIFGCKEGADLIAASFIRSADHVLAIKKILMEQNKFDIPVIAKIENKEGVENFDQIVKVADGIMIARGDLGVELEVSQVPKIQKMMIKKSNFHYKPVITATQMLESMIIYPRPTRAEVSDVANAIYDSTASVMLSGETAIGKYPIETVIQMKNIIKETEEDFDNQSFFKNEMQEEDSDVSSSVTVAAVKTAYSSKAKAFFVYTSSGFTAYLLSRWRPVQPIVALTNSETTYHQLSLVWGVIPVYTKSCKDAEEAFEVMSDFAVKNKIAAFGDLIVVTAGVPFGRKGSTNLMVLDSIGRILVRGKAKNPGKIEGYVKIVRSMEKPEKEKFRKKIVVLSQINENYLSYLETAKGLVLQNTSSDITSEESAIKIAKTLKIPLIVQAKNALTLLSEDKKMVLDADRGFLYFSK